MTSGFFEQILLSTHIIKCFTMSKLENQERFDYYSVKISFEENNKEAIHLVGIFIIPCQDSYQMNSL